MKINHELQTVKIELRKSMLTVFAFCCISRYCFCFFQQLFFSKILVMVIIDFVINRGLLSQIRHLLVLESLLFNRSSVSLKKFFLWLPAFKKLLQSSTIDEINIFLSIH